MRGMHFVSSISHNTSISSIRPITSLIFQMEKPKLRHVKSLSLGALGFKSEALFPFPEHGGLWCCWQNSIEAVEQNRKPGSMLLIVCAGVQSAWVLTRNHSEKEQLPRVGAPAGMTSYTPHSLSLFKESLPSTSHSYLAMVWRFLATLPAHYWGLIVRLDKSTVNFPCGNTQQAYVSSMLKKFFLQRDKRERTEDKSFEAKKVYKAVVPNLIVTMDQFHGRQYFQSGVGGWLWEDSSTLH